MSNRENIQIRAYIELIESRYSFINKGEFLEITDIIFKADFSEHEISFEELEKVQNFANKFNKQVYNSLSKINKIHYTYLKNLHK